MEIGYWVFSFVFQSWFKENELGVDRCVSLWVPGTTLNTYLILRKCWLENVLAFPIGDSRDFDAYPSRETPG